MVQWLKIKGFLGLLLLITFPSKSQNWLGGNFRSNLSFGQYLLKTEQHRDFLYLNKTMRKSGLKKDEREQLNFLTGKAHFELGNFKQAGHFFLQSEEITDTGLSQKTFLGAYSLAKVKAFNKADRLLSEYQAEKPFHSQYRHYFRTGAALLGRNYTLYDSLFPVYEEGHPPLDKFHEDLKTYKASLSKVKDKAPWKGAVLSGLVPGLGKVYAGRPKSGLSAFIQLGFLGVQTYEGYSQKGFQDPHFYIFGSLFTIFYVGNIWGSAQSVKKEKHEQYRKIDRELLKDMRDLNDRFVE